MNQDQLTRQIVAECGVINATLAGLKISAGTHPGGGWAVVAGASYISYGLKLAPNVHPRQINDALPKLDEELSAARRRPCPVRLRSMPLALEVDHPAPTALRWEEAGVAFSRLPAGSALLGRTWDDAGAMEGVWRPADSPHVLIAGTTNSGKSTLQLMALASLMLSTSPAALQVYLIDLKNEDLVRLAGFPHVAGCARDLASAVSMVLQVAAIKDQRVAGGEVPAAAPSVILAIDEFAEFAGQRDVIAAINSLAGVGRSKRVHLFAATQKPLAEVLGNLAKANFTTRLVGRVADASEAATATGRAKSGAEFLPAKRGAFLRVEGADLLRFQAYLFDAAGVEHARALAVRRWAGASAILAAPPPALAAGVTGNVSGEAAPAAPSRTVPPAVAAVFGEYADGDNLRRGGKAAAVRALAGDVAGGRAYQAAADEVDRLFGLWRGEAASAPILKMARGA